MNEREAAMNDFLEKLFSSKAVYLVGFMFGESTTLRSIAGPCLRRPDHTAPLTALAAPPCHCPGAAPAG